MHRLLCLILFLVACSSSDKREYHPPGSAPKPTSARANSRSSYQRPMQQPQTGEIVRLSYEDSPTGGTAAWSFLGSMALGQISPITTGAGGAHVPTFHVRLSSGEVVRVRDPDAPPMARGTRVVILPESGGGYSILPDTRR
jgi:hypothetical protein